MRKRIGITWAIAVSAIAASALPVTHETRIGRDRGPVRAIRLGAGAGPELAGRGKLRGATSAATPRESAPTSSETRTDERPGWLTLAGRLRGEWVLPARVRLERAACTLEPGGWGALVDLDTLRPVPGPVGSRRTITVERDGAFRFSELIPGPYQLLIEGQGAEAVSRGVEVWQNVQDLVLEKSSCTLRGHLEIDDGVRDRHVSVFLVDSGGAQGLFGWCETPAADGSFVFTGLTAGPATLMVMRSQPEGRESGWLQIASLQREYELDLRSPETSWQGRLDPLVPVRLEVVAPSIGRRTRGELKIRAGDGGTEVLRVELGDDSVLRLLKPRMMSGGERVVEEETEGRALRLEGLTPGTYAVTLDLPGYVRASRTVRIERPTRLRWTLQKQPGRWIHAKTKALTWWLEARPVVGDPDAWQEVLWADNRVHWRWRSHPRWAFLPEGQYYLRIRSAAWATTEWGPVGIQDTRTPLLIQPPLARGACLRGDVRAPNVRLLEGIALRLFRARDHNDWVCVPGKRASIRAGRYVFRGLVPGRYCVAPTKARAPVLAEIAVGAEDVECPLDLNPAAPR